jgi:hypothetical protein
MGGKAVNNGRENQNRINANTINPISAQHPPHDPRSQQNGTNPTKDCYFCEYWFPDDPGTDLASFRRKGAKI